MSSRRTSSVEMLGRVADAFSCGPVVFNFSTVEIINIASQDYMQKFRPQGLRCFLIDIHDLHVGDLGPSS